MVVGITDGDTINIRDGNRNPYTVRLACIDAPETSQQPWGAIARDKLISLVPVGSGIRIKPIAKDMYGRTVAEVFTVQGDNINLRLVKDGFAPVYRDYLQGCDRVAYLDAESAARKSRYVFWSQENPIMPWNWRRTQRRLQLGDYGDTIK